jgi:hypothetical protein
MANVWIYTSRSLMTSMTQLQGGLGLEAVASDSSDAYAPAAQTDHAVLTSDEAVTLEWGMTAGGKYHEPWAMRCPNLSAWTGYFDILYHGAVLHRDVVEREPGKLKRAMLNCKNGRPQSPFLMAAD